MRKTILAAIALMIHGAAVAETYVENGVQTSDVDTPDRQLRQRAIGEEVGRIHLDMLIDGIVASGERPGPARAGKVMRPAR